MIIVTSQCHLVLSSATINNIMYYGSLSRNFLSLCLFFVQTVNMIFCYASFGSVVTEQQVLLLQNNINILHLSV